MLGLSSPLVEKRTILFMIRKRMIGRRAYSESVAPSPKSQQKLAQPCRELDASSISSTETEGSQKQDPQRTLTEFSLTVST